MPATKKIKSNFKLTNLFAREPDKAFLTLSPLNMDFEISLTLPADKLQLNLLKMNVYESSVLEVCGRYGNSLSGEIDKLIKIFNKMKKQDVVIDEKEAIRLIDKTLKRFQTMLKTLERDIKKALDSELNYQSRKFEALKQASIDIDIRWKPGDIKLELAKGVTQVPDLPGKEKILLAKKDLWKESGEEESFENLKMPKFMAEVYYIFDKGTAQTLATQKKLNDQLRKEMIDALDKWVITLMRKLLKEFRKLDEKAGEGGVAFRIQYKFWKSKSRKLLTGFQKDLPKELQDVWKKFGRSNKLFSSSDMDVDLKIVLGEAKAAPKRKKREGPVTPLAFAKSMDSLCTAFLKPKKLETLAKALEKQQKTLSDLFLNYMKEFDDRKKKLKKDDTDKAFEMGTSDRNRWKRLVKTFGSNPKEMLNVVDDLMEMAKDIEKDAQTLQKSLTDRLQIKQYAKLESSINDISGNLKSLQKTLKEYTIYHTTCTQAVSDFEDKNADWKPNEKSLKSIPILKEIKKTYAATLDVKKDAYKIVDMKR